MRAAISLLGGMAISAAGVMVVIDTAADLAGVLLIGVGVIVAMLGMRAVGPRVAD